MLDKKICILLLFIMSLCLFNFFKINAKNLPLHNKIIYVDPGHGGIDPGCVYKNIYEKNINLDISHALKKVLEKKGAKVFMTRYADYDLSSNNVRARKKSDLTNRAKIINKSDANIYISIHLNATTSSTWNGPQVFFDDINPKNKKIANIIQQQLNKDLHNKRSYSEIKGMLFNRQVNIPGVLIEVGFLSTPNARFLLQQKDYHEKIADSISKSLVKILYN